MYSIRRKRRTQMKKQRKTQKGTIRKTTWKNKKTRKSRKKQRRTIKYQINRKTKKHRRRQKRTNKILHGGSIYGSEAQIKQWTAEAEAAKVEAASSDAMVVIAKRYEADALSKLASGDYTAARSSALEGLKIIPDHPGCKSVIEKLHDFPPEGWCYKQKPTAKIWRKRYVQIEENGIFFYDKKTRTARTIEMEIATVSSSAAEVLEVMALPESERPPSAADLENLLENSRQYLVKLRQERGEMGEPSSPRGSSIKDVRGYIVTRSEETFRVTGPAPPTTTWPKLILTKSGGDDVSICFETEEETSKFYTALNNMVAGRPWDSVMTESERDLQLQGREPKTGLAKVEGSSVSSARPSSRRKWGDDDSDEEEDRSQETSSGKPPPSVKMTVPEEDIGEEEVRPPHTSSAPAAVALRPAGMNITQGEWKALMDSLTVNLGLGDVSKVFTEWSPENEKLVRSEIKRLEMEERLTFAEGVLNPMEKEQRKKEKRKLRADSEKKGLPKGTRICVGPVDKNLCGKYVSFEKRTLGANNHTIDFDDGGSESVNLRDIWWDFEKDAPKKKVFETSVVRLMLIRHHLQGDQKGLTRMERNEPEKFAAVTNDDPQVFIDFTRKGEEQRARRTGGISVLDLGG